MTGACEENNMELAKRLLLYGANINEAPARYRRILDSMLSDTWYATPLHRAVYENDLDMLRALLESGVSDSSFDMQARNAHGWTALHTAAYLNRVDALEVVLLFTAGSDKVLAALTDLGHTALHLACSRGNTEVVRMLIKHLFTLNTNKKLRQIRVDMK